MKPFLASVVASLSFLAVTAVSAHEQTTDTRICVNVPRQGSRILDRVCGSPEQLAQREQNRQTWMELLSAGATIQPGHSEQPNAVP